MIRSRVRAGLALAGSLLLHASLVGTVGVTHSPWQAPPPLPALEVELRSVAPPAAPAARVVSASVVPAPPVPAPEVSRPPVERAAPAAEEIAAAESVNDEAFAVPPSAAPALDETARHATLPDVAVPDETSAPPPPEAQTAPALAARVLPSRLELRFDVRYGIASGKQSLLWVNEGERYTLSSVAEASGLAGIFYRGRFVQMSRGRLTAQGLQPEEFWDQRGDRRSSARFDAQQLTLLPVRGAPRHFSYSTSPQDALSLFFQLALDVPASGGPLSYTVFNGKKLREYRYASRGEVVLDTALGPLRTLHLERVGEADGRFEAWLAIDRHYLPVRLLRQDEAGNMIELQIQAIAP
ncbi:hypothetical protein Tbd_2664 [Thiobacillus denitrificans ATCC 25259]|uniref:DUF3108 domain-containing protein n=1 Tax=Thiobacillus denitrificans (strain ATCC 25259 / T1) TaxID=292415 RepID=Q3SFJ2_THIDA|nr:DUF3108 domain-containing protein [Thiobacillus denitrificans]AAZ98617.1 hypothetical protein Tbd_2664 [Thiobacillus denitrificans ATCC 25259]